MNRGGHLERVARSLFPHAKIKPIAANTRVPQQLVDGRADAVLTDDLEAPHWQAELPPSRAIGPLTRDLKAAWFPIGGESRAREFDRWLLRYEATGGLARLRERHGLADPRTAAALAALLASLDERLSLMPAVARAKHVLGLPIEDRAQEERVQAAVRQACLRAAREFGSEPPVATAIHGFVDALLRAARFVQERELETAAPSDREAARRDLDQRIRPALAFITERVAWLLVAARSAAPSADPAPTREAISKALARHRLPAELEAEIHAALEALLTPLPPATRTSPAPPSQSAPRDTTPSG